MKVIIKKILPQKLISFIKNLDIFDIHSVKSYSQYGEDMMLKALFEHQEKGFYVDVGAHHPKRYSNTYFFYKRGWSGINIDAMPGSMVLFEKIRPRDVNLEIAIGKDKNELTFYMFSEPLLNSFDEHLSRQRHNDGVGQIVKVEKIITKTLEEVLNENIPDGQKINFLSIDVEGLDLEVLYSNNWQLFRPEYILIEWFNWDIDEVKNNKLYQFLEQKEYSFLAKSIYTVIFVTRELIPEHRKRGICA